VLCSSLLVLALVSPPRLDADRIPLPAEAVQRLGSASFLVNNLEAAAFSPNGKTVYTVSGENERDWRLPRTYPGLIAWEVPTGKKRWQVGVDHQLEQVAADPDGKSVWVVEVVSGKDEERSDQVQRVRYSAVDGKELARTPLVESQGPLALHPTGLVTDGVRLLDREGQWTDLPKLQPAKEGWVAEVVWSPAGDRLFVYTGDAFRERDHCLTSLDVSEKEQGWSVGVDHLVGWCVAPDGRSVGVVTQEQKARNANARRLDAKTGKELKAVEVPPVLSEYQDLTVRAGVIQFAPDGKSVYLIDHEDHATAIGVATWKTTPTKAPVARGAVFSTDGKVVLVPSGRNVILHDMETGKRLSPGEPGFRRADHTTRLRFSAGSDRVTRSDWWKKGIEWDVTTGRETGRTEEKDDLPGKDEEAQSAGGQIKAVLTYKDDKWRVTVTRVGKPKDPPVVLEAGWGERARPYRWLSFTPDASHLVGADPNYGVHIWDVKAGGKPAEVKFGRDGYESIPSEGMQISPNGRMVAVVERGGPVAHFVPPPELWAWAIGVYEIPSGKRVHRFVGNGSLKGFQWMGDRLAALVDLPPIGSPLGVPKPLPERKFKLLRMDPAAKTTREHSLGADVRSWAAAPFGDTVAVGAGDGLRLYEASTGKLRHTFREQKLAVEVLAFSPDGRLLAAESVDGPVLVWDVRGDLTKPAKPDAAGWERAWEALGGADAAKGFQAVRLFALHPDDGIAELKRRYAASQPTAEVIAATVVKLDDREFAVRQRAEQQLRAMGTAAFPAFNQAMGRDPSEELKERARRLLEVEVPADRLRAERAVEAVRLADTDAANKLTAEWAKGPEKDPLTADARPNRPLHRPRRAGRLIDTPNVVAPPGR
jgi:WD40 repeat protein